MSQRDNFGTGFFLGTLVGGVVGGVVGALLASRSPEKADSDNVLLAASEAEGKPAKAKKRAPLPLADERSIEMARRGLEDKIAQLNEAIDDVRQRLGTEHINGQGEDERAVAGDR